MWTKSEDNSVEDRTDVTFTGSFTEKLDHATGGGHCVEPSPVISPIQSIRSIAN